MSNKDIAIGNTEGLYFSHEKLAVLMKIAIEFRKLGATDIRVFYDPNEDFHKCSLSLNNHSHCVEIRYYKVFGIDVDSDRNRITVRSEDSVIKEVQKMITKLELPTKQLAEFVQDLMKEKPDETQSQ